MINAGVKINKIDLRNCPRSFILNRHVLLRRKQWSITGNRDRRCRKQRRIKPVEAVPKTQVESLYILYVQFESGFWHRSD
jgi:hypothetical protein